MLLHIFLHPKRKLATSENP